MPAADRPAAPSGTPPHTSGDRLPPWLAQATGAPLPPAGEDPAALSRGLAESFRAAAERQAAELFLAGEHAELLLLLEAMLKAAPADAGLLLKKGLCLLELGDCRAALAALTAAEQLAPHDCHILLFKMEALLGLGAYRQAERLMRQLLAAAPENCLYRYRLAACLALAGKPRPALEQLALALAGEEGGFREAAALDPAFAGLRSLPAFRQLLNNRRQ